MVFSGCTIINSHPRPLSPKDSFYFTIVDGFQVVPLTSRVRIAVDFSCFSCFYFLSLPFPEDSWCSLTSFSYGNLLDLLVLTSGPDIYVDGSDVLPAV